MGKLPGVRKRGSAVSVTKCAKPSVTKKKSKRKAKLQPLDVMQRNGAVVAKALSQVMHRFFTELDEHRVDAQTNVWKHEVTARRKEWATQITEVRAAYHAAKAWCDKNLTTRDDRSIRLQFAKYISIGITRLRFVLEAIGEDPGSATGFELTAAHVEKLRDTASSLCNLTITHGTVRDANRLPQVDVHVDKEPQMRIYQGLHTASTYCRMLARTLLDTQERQRTKDNTRNHVDTFIANSMKSLAELKAFEQTFLARSDRHCRRELKYIKWHMRLVCMYVRLAKSGMNAIEERIYGLMFQDAKAWFTSVHLSFDRLDKHFQILKYVTLRSNKYHYTETAKALEEVAVALEDASERLNAASRAKKPRKPMTLEEIEVELLTHRPKDVALGIDVIARLKDAKTERLVTEMGIRKQNANRIIKLLRDKAKLVAETTTSQTT